MAEPLIQLVEELKRLDRKRQILGKLPPEDAKVYDRIKAELNKRMGGGDASRRGEIRVSTSLRVRYHTGTTFVNNYINNMSHGGVFVVTPTPLPMDSVVQLHLYFEDDKKEVVVEGKVVWENTNAGRNKDVTRAGMGVKFTKVPDEARSVMEKLIHAKLESFAQNSEEERNNDITNPTKKKK